MSHALDRLGVALLDASLAAITITGLVVLAMVQCRQPSRRLGWARAGLISSLALLPLSALNPVPRIDVPGRLRTLLPSGVEEPPTRVSTSGDGCYSSPFPNDIRECDLTGDRPDRADGHPRNPPWLRWPARAMVVCYLAGVALGLGALVFGLWGSAWLARRGRPPSKESLANFASLPFEGRTARPRLLISDRVGRPVLLGTIRPIILIPPELEGPGSADKLRLSLLHELAHAEAADHRFGPAATLAGAIWFFLPSIWWIRGQMKLDQEFLADRRAVIHFGTTGGYASSLVDLAEALPSNTDRSASSPAPLASASVPGAASALFQRVLMLVKCPFAIEGRSPAWWRWSTALTIGLITLSASCLTIRGLAGRSTSMASEVGPPQVLQSIRIPQLLLSPREHDDQPFDLRLRLPQQFSLTFEVMAEPDDLPGLEVLGHPLGPVADPDPAHSVYRLWHRVQIRRAESREVILVDGRHVLAPAMPARLASWLTIRPLAGRPTRFRELELAW